MLGLNLGTGKTRWKTRSNPDLLAPGALLDWAYAIAGGPALSTDGMLVVPTLYGELVGLDASSGTVLWRHASMPSVLRTTHYRGSGMAGYEGSPVIADNVVWAADTAGVLVALDLHTGNELWHTSLGAPVLASLAVADGWLVAASYDGTVHAMSLPVAAVVTPAAITGGCDAGGGGGVALALALVLALVLVNVAVVASRRRRARAR